MAQQDSRQQSREDVPQDVRRDSHAAQRDHANQASDAGYAGGANRNDWQVSAGEAQAADQQSARGTEPRGSFAPVGGDDSISALPGAPNPD